MPERDGTQPVVIPDLIPALSSGAGPVQLLELQVKGVELQMAYCWIQDEKPPGAAPRRDSNRQQCKRQERAKMPQFVRERRPPVTSERRGRRIYKTFS